MRVNDELRIHWENLLKPIFPDESIVEVNPNKRDFIVRALWELGTDDPVRPSKMSKSILVIVPFETADDYLNKNAAQRTADDEKLQEYVKAKLSNHNPDHDTPQNASPPIVRWVADSSVLNS